MVSLTTELKPLLQNIRLNGMAEIIEMTLSDALEEKWSYSQFLLHLFTREVERREHKRQYIRLAKSGLNPVKTLETFDFTFNKNISKKIILELARCDFVKKHQNIFLVGPSGVGKSHLANGIGHEVCRKGYRILMKRTSELLEGLHSGKGDGSFDKKYKEIISIPVLIIDDFGLIPIKEHFQIYLYEIIAARYEKHSTIITSNRDFSEWISVFDNPLVGSAAMDRLVHNAIKLSIEGDSFRNYNFKLNQKKMLRGG